MSDGDYVVQGIYADGRICYEGREDDEQQAISIAKSLSEASWFEGVSVRVITRDGELIVEFDV
jgi:hypothetical protein